ncbi:lipocalin-like domain-containing protein [Streptomyces sp. VRA16 Mangrove soil]|uniref:lipocalin-like domain-containing protein n=1 Tax=Streptomyces sp. VRA16 Mangrove soil TaxID=2817434 RepID=UPI001A9F62BD|nr:lipocalin-like domain-containing protein [Streptomyces sp. VRA16 Mangrove soil]MBO1332595.1 hydroxyneurosporene dehydrogenase [Streptomyces sp. VRA16 Mangrove soil]
MSRNQIATSARTAGTPEDYARFGIEEQAIKPWEDGLRTDGSAGTYEWWYFDAHLDDGAKLVVVFFTKEFSDINRPVTPAIRIDLTLPDGSQEDRLVEFDPRTFTASTEGCDVRIGDNVFTGDLHTYTIRGDAEGISFDVTLTGQVPAWRPQTGHFVFGEQGEEYFAWLPSVPQGHVEATYSANGRTSTTTGVGYHDHNWGNAPMLKLMHHWYWARGAAGPYSVIASYITAEKAYGYAEMPIFMLARDGKLVADDSNKITFEELGSYTDSVTGKPVGNVTRYTYTDGDERYLVTWTRHTDIAATRMADDIKGPKKVAAKLAGFDGAYLRFTGEVRIERYQGEKRVEDYTDEALWELMYFGKART